MWRFPTKENSISLALIKILRLRQKNLSTLYNRIVCSDITSVGGAKPTASTVPQEPCGVLNANTVTGPTMFSVSFSIIGNVVGYLSGSSLDSITS